MGFTKRLDHAQKELEKNVTEREKAKERREKLLDLTLDITPEKREEKLEKVDEQIRYLEREFSILQLEGVYCSLMIEAKTNKTELDQKVVALGHQITQVLQDMAANKVILEQKLDDNQKVLDKISTGFVNFSKDATEALKKQTESLKIITEAGAENKKKIKKNKKLIEAFIDDYQTDRNASLGLAITGLALSLVGLAIGAAALGIAIKALKDAGNATPASDTNPAPVSGGTNSFMRVGPIFSFANTATNEDSITADKLAETIENLMIDKSLLASGKIPQNEFWQELAKNVDENNLESQDFTLISIQEALVDLPETQDFLWLDAATDMEEKYNQLYKAYETSNKTSDIYVEATKLKYQGKEMPFFHVAMLLQMTLALVKHHLRFTDDIKPTDGSRLTPF